MSRAHSLIVKTVLIWLPLAPIAAQPPHGSLQEAPKVSRPIKVAGAPIGGDEVERVSRDEIEKLILESKNLSFEKRLEKISAYFIGRPYDGNGPLGEGKDGDYDKDPLFRTDKFDCTTFVETVLSIALAKDFHDFQKNINAIRYKDGKVSFVARNHFPDLDWIPNNAKAGFLRDVTAQVAGKHTTELATAEINKRGWYKKMAVSSIQVPGLSEDEKAALLERLRNEGNLFEPVFASVPYLSLETIFHKKESSAQEQRKRQAAEALLREKYENDHSLTTPEQVNSAKKKLESELAALKLENRVADSEIQDEILKAIPSGTVLNIVRPNWDLVAAAGTHMNISHQGFVIQKDGVPYYRFPSAVGDKKVSDIRLEDYLKKFLLSPTIKGITLVQPLPRNVE